MRENLFADLLRATAPLLVWALHFTLCYGLVGAQCSPALITPDAPARGVLIAASLGAALLCAFLLWRGWPARTGNVRLLDWAIAGSAVLALAGIALTALPLLLLDGCG